jgi:hypothetical protein
MDVPLTGTELHAAFKKLQNGRACGKDLIAGELLKYGGEMLAQVMATIIINHAVAYRHWSKEFITPVLSRCST